MNARWWLMNSNGKTRAVIIVHITLTANAKGLLIEMWTMIDHPGRITRSSPRQVPAPTSSITIDDQGVTAPQNAELRIPYEGVFDAPPPLGISDIVIPNAQLQTVVRFIFAGL